MKDHNVSMFISDFNEEERVSLHLLIGWHVPSVAERDLEDTDYSVNMPLRFLLQVGKIIGPAYTDYLAVAKAYADIDGFTSRAQKARLHPRKGMASSEINVILHSNTSGEILRCWMDVQISEAAWDLLVP